MSPDTTHSAQPEAPAFDRRMLEALICPRTQTTLSYDADKQAVTSAIKNIKAAGYEGKIHVQRNELARFKLPKRARKPGFIVTVHVAPWRGTKGKGI